MGNEDKPSEFEELISELERAVQEIGVAQPAHFLATPTADEGDEGVQFLSEAPPSLVNVRALTTAAPLSHAPTQIDDHAVELGPGVVIDHKYEVLRPVPETPNGWEVRHVVLRQKFHMQMLARSVVDDAVMWPRFQNDIRAAGMLGHEHIEFVTDLGRCSRYGAYIVKQWTEGPTLAQWLQQSGARPAPDVVAFVHTIGEALAALHEIGIVHGRLSATSVRRVVGARGPMWKLLDVCIPSGTNALTIPEQVRGDATGPEADQYALAYLAWVMLLGPGGTLDDDPDVPIELRAALRVALDEEPFHRWPDVDAFIAEVSRALPAKPEPSVHPFDRREASRVVAQEANVSGEDRAKRLPEARPRASSGFEDARPRSMAIKVHLGDAPAVHVQFNTGARLRRDYRRNMLAGGLFVPTTADLQIGGRVLVNLLFTPRSAALVVDGLVVTHDPGSDTRPPGFGVAFDVPARRKIEDFVRDLNLGIGLAAGDELVTMRKLDASAKLDAGSAFLLSRLGVRTTVGEARAMFAGLPYDFDECVSKLVEERYLEVRPPGSSTPARETPRHGFTAAPAKPSPPPPPAHPARVRETQPPQQPREQGKPQPGALRDHEWGDIERVLETAQYFEEQGNYLAASRVLTSATAHVPDAAVFHHRLALIRARFQMDLSGARLAIRAAVALEPDNADFAGAERYIATLVEIAAVRIVWERAMPGTTTWLRTEPDLGLAWFEERYARQVWLHTVNYEARTAERASRGPGWQAVRENDPEFDALERRKPVPINSGRARRARQVELARRFGGLGPHFEAEPIAAARTVNSTLAARTDDGLRVFREDTQLSHLSNRPVRKPRFSPHDQHLAWCEEHTSGWNVCIAAITGPSIVRARVQGEPKFFWTDDSSALIVHDTRSNHVFWVDRRRGEPRLVLAPGASIDVVVAGSVDDDSLFVVARKVVGQSRWSGTWVDARTGEVHAEYLLPDGAKSGIVRSDGKLALTLRDGRLFVADLKRKSMKVVSTCNPLPESLTDARWELGKPLVIAEQNGHDARILSIDVDLLCG